MLEQREWCRTVKLWTMKQKQGAERLWMCCRAERNCRFVITYHTFHKGQQAVKWIIVDIENIAARRTWRPFWLSTCTPKLVFWPCWLAEIQLNLLFFLLLLAFRRDINYFKVNENQTSTIPLKCKQRNSLKVILIFWQSFVVICVKTGVKNISNAFIRW